MSHNLYEHASLFVHLYLHTTNNVVESLPTHPPSEICGMGGRHAGALPATDRNPGAKHVYVVVRQSKMPFLASTNETQKLPSYDQGCARDILEPHEIQKERL